MKDDIIDPRDMTMETLLSEVTFSFTQLRFIFFGLVPLRDD